MKLLESCSIISVAVYLLVTNGFEFNAKYFTSLYVGVRKAYKFGLKGGKPSTQFLYILHYSRSSSHWFQMSLCFYKHAVKVNRFFILTANKIQESFIFHSRFLKFALII